jgi:hypothetical protein
MFCTNGHNNLGDANVCSLCGVNTFQVAPVAVSVPVNGLAIASMVLGIVWVYSIGSILALVLGYIAKRQINARGQRGGGMATTGIVLGWVGVGFLLAFSIVAIAATNHHN